MYTALSYKAFAPFCNMCDVEQDEDDPIITMETHLIPDDENEDFEGQALQPDAPDASQQGVDWSQPPKTPVSLDLDATDCPNLPVIIEDKEYTESCRRVPLLASQVESHVSCQNAKHGQAVFAPKDVGQVPGSNLHQLLVV
ncbi:hypothetical protein MHU86_6975 [Fragilaria crotonensis]|nr:hypothetical protein MHU86_6975 [Fragilaria crotonensis]